MKRLGRVGNGRANPGPGRTGRLAAVAVLAVLAPSLGPAAATQARGRSPWTVPATVGRNFTVAAYEVASGLSPRALLGRLSLKGASTVSYGQVAIAAVRRVGHDRAVILLEEVDTNDPPEYGLVLAAAGIRNPLRSDFARNVFSHPPRRPGARFGVAQECRNLVGAGRRAVGWSLAGLTRYKVASKGYRLSSTQVALAGCHELLGQRDPDQVEFRSAVLLNWVRRAGDAYGGTARLRVDGAYTVTLHNAEPPGSLLPTRGFAIDFSENGVASITSASSPAGFSCHAEGSYYGPGGPTNLWQCAGTWRPSESVTLVVRLSRPPRVNRLGVGQLEVQKGTTAEVRRHTLPFTAIYYLAP